MKKLMPHFFVLLLAACKPPTGDDTVSPVADTAGMVHIYALPASVSGTVYEVGPGKTYPDLSSLPVQDLTGGDLVKIYYRSNPYATELRLTTRASAEAPLRIQGIPDEAGNLPVISGNGARLSSNHTVGSQGLGVLTVCGPWHEKPSYIEIVNLAFQDGNENTSFTNVTGNSVRHNNGAAGIWIKGDNISVLGCVIRNNGNGLFSQANNNEIEEMTTGLLVEGCWFEDNGAQASELRHSLYTQGLNTTIQFCTIRCQAWGAMGSSIKDRSAGTIIRYNYIETSARTIDIVEPDSTETILLNEDNIDNYNNVFIYGNIIVNNEATYRGSGNAMIHFGGDNGALDTYRKGTLWFYDNIVSINRNEGFWNMRLFDLNDADSDPLVIETGTVRMYNNTIFGTGDSMHFCLLREHGTIEFNGGNWLSDNFEDSAISTAQFSVTGRENLLPGEDPGFAVSTEMVPVLGPSAPGVIGRVILPPNLSGIYPVIYRYKTGKIMTLR